ncbi:MAG: GlxA family transcriptional regulator, partial [Proteobacteria bacterium]
MQRKRKIVGFLLVDEFSMMGFSSAIEALRQANRLVEEPPYEWYTCSVDGRPAVCSAGIRIDAAHDIATAPEPDLLLVVSSIATGIAGEEAIHRRLRYFAGRGARLG